MTTVEISEMNKDLLSLMPAGFTRNGFDLVRHYEMLCDVFNTLKEGRINAMAGRDIFPRLTDKQIVKSKMNQLLSLMVKLRRVGKFTSDANIAMYHKHAPTVPPTDWVNSQVIKEVSGKLVFNQEALERQLEISIVNPNANMIRVIDPKPIPAESYSGEQYDDREKRRIKMMADESLLPLVDMEMFNRNNKDMQRLVSEALHEEEEIVLYTPQVPTNISSKIMMKTLERKKIMCKTVSFEKVCGKDMIYSSNFCKRALYSDKSLQVAIFRNNEIKWVPEQEWQRQKITSYDVYATKDIMTRPLHYNNVVCDVGTSGIIYRGGKTRVMEKETLFSLHFSQAEFAYNPKCEISPAAKYVCCALRSDIDVNKVQERVYVYPVTLDGKVICTNRRSHLNSKIEEYALISSEVKNTGPYSVKQEAEDLLASCGLTAVVAEHPDKTLILVNDSGNILVSYIYYAEMATVNERSYNVVGVHYDEIKLQIVNYMKGSYLFGHLNKYLDLNVLMALSTYNPRGENWNLTMIGGRGKKAYNLQTNWNMHHPTTDSVFFYLKFRGEFACEKRLLLDKYKYRTDKPKEDWTFGDLQI